MFDLDFFLSAGGDDDIVLRVPKMEDVSALFHLVDSNREYLRRFLGWLDYNRSEEDTIAFIKMKQEQFVRKESLTLLIWYKEILVGVVGFHDIDLLNRSASVGYWLDESHQGKGIMTKSVKALVDHGFDAMELHRIEIRCAVENERSQQIPTSLGFRKEGRLKDACWHYGDYFDADLYGLIVPAHSPVFETERMILRKLTMDDVDNLQRVFSDPEAMRYCPGTKNIDETKAWIQKQLDCYTTRGFGLWACHLKETGEFVGQCGLIFWDDIAGQEEVEIGYSFIRQHWKKGFATEAAKGCLNYAREALGRCRLVALIRPDNKPSRAVAERVGMKIEKEAEVKGIRALVYAIES